MEFLLHLLTTIATYELVPHPTSTNLMRGAVHAAAVGSVPLPLYMDEMLDAGRRVYDKHSTPTQDLGIPTRVNLSMYIEGIGSFMAQTMDFQLDVYLQQFWRDPRLAHNESMRILLRDKSILDKIWHPDVYFANARIAQFHSVTQDNFLIWIEPDGSILYDTRVSMVVICAMQLQNFPLDSQWCHLRILSYAYDVSKLNIAWVEHEPITRNHGITMSDMHIVKLLPGTCDGNYSTGEWSCVTAEFFVSREITHHILQTYVPTTLIVVISWFSFWLDVEAVPARVSLAITTLLTLSTQANSVKQSLPEVSYMKSLDLFLAVSVLFVFGVLIEFTIVNYTQRNATIASSGVAPATSNSKAKKKQAQNTSKVQSASSKNASRAADERTAFSNCPRSSQVTARQLASGYGARMLAWMRQRRVGRVGGAIHCNHCYVEEGTMGTSPILGDPRRREVTTSMMRRRFGSLATAQEMLQIVTDTLRLKKRGYGSMENRNGAQIEIPQKGCQSFQQRRSQQHVAIAIDHQQNMPQTTCPLPARINSQREVAARLAHWDQPQLGTRTGEWVNGNIEDEDVLVDSADVAAAVLPLQTHRGKMAASMVGDGESAGEFVDSNFDCASSTLSDESYGSGALARAQCRMWFGTSRTPTTEESVAVNQEANKRGEGGSGARRKIFNSGSDRWRHAVRQLQRNRREAGRIQAKKIDAWSRWAFPISYLLFHIVYWTYYLWFA